MKQSDYENIAHLFERARIRHQQSPVANPLVLQVFDMLQHEFEHAHEVVPVDPETP